MSGHFKKISLAFMLASTTALIATDAFATEGYFVHGAGARNKAMGGAGVADGTDATALITNPAGMVGAGTQATIAVSLFSPNRRFTGSGTAQSFTPGGEFKSSENIFAIPTAAYVYQIDDTSSWGISLAANGGMNSNYRDVSNGTCQFLFNTAGAVPADNGVFCGGTTGVNISQALVSVGYAKQFGSFKIGVAPIFAFQTFEAIGLQAFGGATLNPAALSNVGSSKSTGFGGKIGFEWAVSDQIRVGGTYQSKIDMDEFEEYAGLFADGGDFDIPSNYQVGVSADITPSLTVSIDYKHIKYSDAGSVSNPSSIMLPFGSDNGPGFGWDNLDIIKVGAEWDMNDQLTWRLGYAHNSQPIDGSDVTLNLLAPGVVTDHFTGGGEFALNDTHSFEFGLMYAPTERISGIEVTPQGPNPGHTIEIEMKQFEVTAGWKMKFGR